MAALPRTVVVDEELDRQASRILGKLGLSVDDALRILLARVVEENDFPLALYVPNAETMEAMEELARGEGKRYSTSAEMFADLENWN